MLFDPELIAAVAAQDEARLLARAEVVCPDGYFDGSDGLQIEWVAQGALFRINEYDGSESLIVQQDDGWIAA